MKNQGYNKYDTASRSVPKKAGKGNKPVKYKAKPKPDYISVPFKTFAALILCRRELQDIYKKFNNGVVNAITSPGLNADVDWKFIDNWEKDILDCKDLSKNVIEEEFDMASIVRTIVSKNKGKPNAFYFLRETEISIRYHSILNGYGVYDVTSCREIEDMLEDADEDYFEFYDDIEESFGIELSMQDTVEKKKIDNLTIAQLGEVFAALKNLGSTVF